MKSELGAAITNKVASAENTCHQHLLQLRSAKTTPTQPMREISINRILSLVKHHHDLRLIEPWMFQLGHP